MKTPLSRSLGTLFSLAALSAPLSAGLALTVTQDGSPDVHSITAIDTTESWSSFFNGGDLDQASSGSAVSFFVDSASDGLGFVTVYKSLIGEAQMKLQLQGNEGASVQITENSVGYTLFDEQYVLSGWSGIDSWKFWDWEDDAAGFVFGKLDPSFTLSVGFDKILGLVPHAGFDEWKVWDAGTASYIDLNLATGKYAHFVAVPEPSMLLLGVTGGILGLLVCGRRRRLAA